MSTLRDHVMRRGLVRRRDADHAIHATLTALGAYLDEPEARLLCDVLPDELSSLVARRHFDGQLDSAGFFHDVERTEHTPASRAKEDAEIVCAALAEILPNESRARLTKELPPPLAALFVLEASPEAPPHATRHDARHHTLATGEPGSRHPISESPPPAPVAHAETKLSTAHGLTQEELGESLATAKPRDERTIARSRD